MKKHFKEPTETEFFLALKLSGFDHKVMFKALTKSGTKFSHFP